MTIIVADDHLMIREGIKQIILKMRNMQIIAEAETGLEALEYAKKLPCDILLIDINMPELNGIEVLSRIKTEKPELKVIVYSMFCDKNTIHKAVKNDVDGYILKDDSESVFLDVVKNVAAGNKTFSPRIQSIIFSLAADSHMSPLEKLTIQELEVFNLLTEGKKRSDIAEELGIAIRTVDFHTRNLKDKLHTENIGDLIRLRREHSL